MTSDQPTDVRGARDQQQPANRKLSKFLVLVLVIDAITLTVIAVWLYFWWKASTLRKSEPYRLAVKLIQLDGELVAKLGQPIEDASLLPTGEVVRKGARGRARLSFKVRGPQGSAAILVQANCVGGTWSLTMLDALLEDGTRLNLLRDRGSGGGNEAPRWQPQKKQSEEPKADSAQEPAVEVEPSAPKLEIELPEVPNR